MGLDLKINIKTEQDAIKFVDTLSKESRETLFRILKKKRGNDLLDEDDFETNNDSINFSDEIFQIDIKGLVETEKMNDNGRPVLVGQSRDGKIWESLEKISKGAKKAQIFSKDSFLESVAVDKNCSVEEAKQKYFITKETFKEKMSELFLNGKYNQFYMNIKNNYAVFAHNDIVCRLDTCFFFWLADGSIGIIDKTGYRVCEKDTENYKCCVLLLKE